MANKLIKKYEPGNTVRFDCSFRGLDQVLTDPSAPYYRIFNIKNEVIQEGEPLSDSTGNYYCYHTPNEVGQYVIEFTGGVDGKSVAIRWKFVIQRSTWKGEWSSSSSSNSLISTSSSSSSSSSSSMSAGSLLGFNNGPITTQKPLGIYDGDHIFMRGYEFTALKTDYLKALRVTITKPEGSIGMIGAIVFPITDNEEGEEPIMQCESLILIDDLETGEQEIEFLFVDGQDYDALIEGQQYAFVLVYMFDGEGEPENDNYITLGASDELTTEYMFTTLLGQVINENESCAVYELEGVNENLSSSSSYSINSSLILGSAMAVDSDLDWIGLVDITPKDELGNVFTAERSGIASTFLLKLSNNSQNSYLGSIRINIYSTEGEGILGELLGTSEATDISGFALGETVQLSFINGPEIIQGINYIWTVETVEGYSGYISFIQVDLPPVYTWNRLGSVPLELIGYEGTDNPLWFCMLAEATSSSSSNSHSDSTSSSSSSLDRTDVVGFAVGAVDNIFGNLCEVGYWSEFTFAGKYGWSFYPTQSALPTLLEIKIKKNDGCTGPIRACIYSDIRNELIAESEPVLLDSIPVNEETDILFEFLEPLVLEQNSEHTIWIEAEDDELVSNFYLAMLPDEPTIDIIRRYIDNVEYLIHDCSPIYYILHGTSLSSSSSSSDSSTPP